MAARRSVEQRLHEYEEAYRELASQLAATGHLWPGSISVQRLTCGKPACRCHQDPRHRHGPYTYWSTKAKGKTVNRLLKPDEATLYQEWIENRRRLEKLQRQMVRLSQKLAPLLLRRMRAHR